MIKGLEAYTLADWGLDAAFMRIRPGSEDRLSTWLRRRHERGSRLFKCFGHYDMVQISATISFSELSSLHADADILQVCRLGALAWESPFASRKPEDWPEWSAATLTLLKLHPDAVESRGLEFELATLRHTAAIPGSNVFSSLGHSEVVLLLQGDDLEALLRQVTLLITETAVSDILVTNEPRVDDASAFVRSLTFPLVSYERVFDRGRYDELKGEAAPKLRIACQPGAEDKIAAALPEQMRQLARHTYGRFDVAVTSTAKLPLAEFLESLIEFRKAFSYGDALYATHTEFDCEPLAPGSGKYSDARREPKGPREILPDFAELLGNGQIPLHLRAAVADFLGRYLACEADQYLASEFRDMIGFVRYVHRLLTQFVAHLDDRRADRAFLIQDILEQLLELGSVGLYQRYATIEAHLEGVPYPPFSSTVGSNRVIAAASCIPLFAYSEGLRPAGDASAWDGFACFSDRGFQNSPGEILTYASWTLLDPTAWMTITHEIGHGAYDALKLTVIEPSAIDRFYQALQKAPAFESLKRSDLFWELFAHWFDYRYFHPHTSVGEFITEVWQSWIDVPMVWEQKGGYLFRSFLVYLTDQPAALAATAEEPEQRRKYLDEALQRMLTALGDKVERFDQYMLTVTEQQLTDVREAAFYSLDVYVDCETTFRKEVYDALTAHHEDAKRQAELLSSRIVVLDHVRNPIAVLLSLRRSQGGRPCSLGVAGAVILTFCYDFKRRQRELLRQTGVEP